VKRTRSSPGRAAVRSWKGSSAPSGADVRFLPVMGRKLRTAWRHWFLCDDVDSYPVPRVRLGPGGWYLTGEPSALVVVEVLRAKGHGALRVEPAPTPERRDREEENGCREEEPKIAS
jgi:hypothetical protein